MCISGTLPRNMNGSSNFCKGPRTRKVRGLYDFASPQTFVKTTAPIPIFCGSNIPDKNSKSIEIFQKCCENTLVKKKLDGKSYYYPSYLDGSIISHLKAEGTKDPVYP